MEKEKELQVQPVQPAQQTAAAAAPQANAAVTPAATAKLPDYASQVTNLYGQISNRQPFSYDVDGDALYQQYKDRYQQNAKMAMKDTLGQTAMLTGGYGNSYGHAVGQQAYDRTMQGLTDKIPELQQNAFNMYQAEGNRLGELYGMAAQGEQQQYGRQQDSYSQIAALISSSGYEPNDEELAAAGMNKEQANALKQAWIVQNPMMAYQNGAIDAEVYHTITGEYPPDYSPAGGGWWDGSGTPGTEDIRKLQMAINQNAKVTGTGTVAVTGKDNAETAAAAQALADYNARLYKHYGGM